MFPMSSTRNGFHIGSTLTDGKLTRIDVLVPDFLAPGGGRVGMSKAEMRALYPTMTKDLHKYV